MKRSFAARKAFGIKLGLSPSYAGTLAKLSSPEAVQDFIAALPQNFEPEGDTCMSVAQVLRKRRAHCIEAAFVAAAALWMNGFPPLLMDMQAEGDDDHVITIFKKNNHWGAISKSNHAWLRWRDPVYRSLRELTMSYFHEYTNKKRKTLRAYSVPIDLRKFKIQDWVTNQENCWDVAGALDDVRHYKLITPAQSRSLKLRDSVEMKADKVTQYKKLASML